MAQASCESNVLAGLHGGREVLRGFFASSPDNWQEIVAEVTSQWGWGPDDAWGLTWTMTQWWLDQGNRIAKKAKEQQGG
jgi:hypothetical protein